MSQVPVLEVRDLEVTYSARIVGVRGISFDVAEGEVVAIIGPNGAGKTSTLRAVAGFQPREAAHITRGSVWLAGIQTTTLAPHRVSKLGVGLVPERDKVFLELSPREHLRVSIGRGGAALERAVAGAIEVFPTLQAHLDRAAGLLSGGQRQMLAMATALASQPRILLVDEFSQGLAPVVVRALTRTLRDLNRRGMTMLLVEQNVGAAVSVAHRVLVMEAGQITASGAPHSLRESGALADVLGGL